MYIREKKKKEVKAKYNNDIINSNKNERQGDPD
jgi:hypothetical protein